MGAQLFYGVGHRGGCPLEHDFFHLVEGEEVVIPLRDPSTKGV